jgi:hypothetical protein
MHYHNAPAACLVFQHSRDDFLLAVREKLSEGVKVLLYPHEGGSPDYAHLSLTYPFTCLTFEKESGHKEIVVIDDLSEIRPYTEDSYTFTRMNMPRVCEGKNHLFTLIASEKSIPCAATTPELCLFLVKGLKLILDCAIPTIIKRLRGKESFSEERLKKIIKHNQDNDNVEFAESVKFKLKQGIDVLYVRRNGKYKQRIMTLDTTDTRLIFLRRRVDDIAVKLSVIDSLLMYFEGPEAGIDLSDISEIRPGFTSAMFAKIEPPPDPSREHMAFSFISSERTIAILTTNEQERAFIMTDFLSWIHTMRLSSTMY